MTPTQSPTPLLDESTIAVGDRFEYADADKKRRVFTLTRIDRTGRCFGSHDNSSRTIGCLWTARRLAHGWRNARRIATGQPLTQYKPGPRYHDSETKKAPPVRSRLPRGFGSKDIAELRKCAAEGRSTEWLARAFGISPLIVADVLAGRAA